MSDDRSWSPGNTLDKIMRGKATDEDWRRFYIRYGRRIFLWAIQHGLQEADAEDITQIVLLLLLEKMQQFKPEKGRFRSWLARVIHNAWVDFLRKQGRSPRAEGGSVALEKLHTLEARKDLQARVNEAFDLDLLEMAEAEVQPTVPEQSWQCYWLTQRERRSGADVGAQLGLEREKVFAVSHSVLRRIRDAVQRLAGDPEVPEEGQA
jgi:RNA polymerase sigma factor (sigma-70 family)